MRQIGGAVLLVVAVGGLGIDEGPQADGVEPVVLEQLQDVLLRAVAVGRAGRLVALHEGDVRADEIGR